MEQNQNIVVSLFDIVDNTGYMFRNVRLVASELYPALFEKKWVGELLSRGQATAVVRELNKRYKEQKQKKVKNVN